MADLKTADQRRTTAHSPPTARMPRKLQALLPLLLPLLVLTLLSSERGPVWLRLAPHCPRGYDGQHLDPVIVSRLMRQYTGQPLPSGATAPNGRFRLNPEEGTLQFRFQLPVSDALQLYAQVETQWREQFYRDHPDATYQGDPPAPTSPRYTLTDQTGLSALSSHLDAPETRWRPDGYNVLSLQPSLTPERGHTLTQLYIDPLNGAVGFYHSLQLR